MAKVKFNIRTLDKATGVIHEPSNEFVEVSEAFAKRIKEIQSVKGNEKGYEWEAAKESKPKKADKHD